MLNGGLKRPVKKLMNTSRARLGQQINKVKSAIELERQVLGYQIGLIGIYLYLPIVLQRGGKPEERRRLAKSDKSCWRRSHNPTHNMAMLNESSFASL